jgi:subfamily B ATP-binding cassette protein MsbA
VPAPSPRPGFRETLETLWGPYLELRQFLKPYRRRFWLGLGCGALFGLVNGSLPLVIQQVSAIIFYGEVQNAALARFFGAGGKIPPGLVTAACVAIPVAMILRGFFSFMNAYLVEWVSHRVLMDLRRELLARMMRQGLDFFHRARAGQLISRITNDTREAQSALTTVSTDLISQPISLVTGLFVLFQLDWKFMLGTLFVFPICLMPARRLGKRLRAAATREEAEKGEMLVILNEIFAGIKVVKSFSRSGYELERFHASSEAQFQMAMRVRRAMETMAPVIEGMAALWVGIAFFYVHQTRLPGNTFIALCAGIFLLYQPVKTLTRLHLFMQKCSAATKSVFDLFRLVPTVVDAPGARMVKTCRGEITFENVHFAYRPGVPALEKITLRFEPGRYYALVGPSGAGKSTLLSLILRFYDPGSGTVRLDGADLRDLNQDSLRDQVGIVAQDTFLFHDTIYRNIAYGRLDATPEEVIAASKQAHAHEFILAQPEGYESIIGDKGCLLSGGQQQRLAIARALLKNAPILLLDEATSSLDSESEAQIQAALETLAQGRTVIAIAHRLSTILKADQIIVLDAGRVIEAGSHRELLAHGGAYRRLYDLQFQHAVTAPDLLSPETRRTDDILEPAIPPRG